VKGKNEGKYFGADTVRERRESVMYDSAFQQQPRVVPMPLKHGLKSKVLSSR
jgi:hypothetical protein